MTDQREIFIPGPPPRLPQSMVAGIPIIENPYLPDDQMIIGSDLTITSGPVIFVGIQPPDPIKQAGRDARLAVRRGLADVLAWLGEDVVTEPLMPAIRLRAASDKRGLPPWFRTSPAPKTGGLKP